jgi:glycosyltransferase involved in cell wall biosynthesis
MAGHAVGVVCDATTGGATAETLLNALEPHCALGVHRLPMARLPGLGDLAAARRVLAVCRERRPQVLHGHGAKGGVYARLAAPRAGARAFYTPHGGSLHYAWTSPAGALFLTAERLLLPRTSGLLFVCEYERDAFARKVGLGGRPWRVVHNGLWPEEFHPVSPATHAADIVFVGELRHIKGLDLLIAAIAEASRHLGRPITATIVGEGPDRARFEDAAAVAGISGAVRFLGAMPAAEAFPLGRLMVIPSRAESFPYVVLEAMAVGIPLVASDVGGIGEAVDAEALVPPGDISALAAAIVAILADPEAARAAAAARMARIKGRFRAQGMAEDITAFYRSAGA